jgi:hypothetical protein
VSASLDAYEGLVVDIYHNPRRVLITHQNRVQHTLENVGLVKRLTRVRTEHVAGLALADVLLQHRCDAAVKLDVALAIGCLEKILLLVLPEFFNDAESPAIVQDVLDLETEYFAEPQTRRRLVSEHITRYCPSARSTIKDRASRVG